MAAMPGGFEDEPDGSWNGHHGGESSTDSSRRQPPRSERTRRRYGPRTCRICLETVHPTFPEDLGGAFASQRPTYISEDADSGRLISPCKCKGSQKYVHEGCLQAWRVSAADRTRNYFECPTCKFKYRLERIYWARWLMTEINQLILTILICAMIVFLLGFVADPILDFWIDPGGTVAGVILGPAETAPRSTEKSSSWWLHLLKGFASLGILGFAKVLAPWHWTLRNTWYMNSGGRRPGTTGRGRLESISWAVVLIGAITFMYSVWKGVKSLSRRTLQRASERVYDVGNDDDEDEDEDGGHEHNE